MAELPKERFTPNEPPFLHVGTDLFGPFFIKTKVGPNDMVSFSLALQYALYMHIEIAYSLETSSFIQALRHFVARRGPAVEIKSDNGTNFVGS